MAARAAALAVVLLCCLAPAAQALTTRGDLPVLVVVAAFLEPRGQIGRLKAV